MLSLSNKNGEQGLFIVEFLFSFGRRKFPDLRLGKVLSSTVFPQTWDRLKKKKIQRWSIQPVGGLW